MINLQIYIFIYNSQQTLHYIKNVSLIDFGYLSGRKYDL